MNCAYSSCTLPDATSRIDKMREHLFLAYIYRITYKIVREMLFKRDSLPAWECRSTGLCIGKDCSHGKSILMGIGAQEENSSRDDAATVVALDSFYSSFSETTWEPAIGQA